MDTVRITSAQLQTQEVRRTRNARIVISDRLLALPLQLLLRKIEVFGHKFPEVLLDRFLVLRGGRNDLGVENCAALVDAVAMIKNTSRSLRARVSGDCPYLHVHRGFVGRLVMLDKSQRFIACKENFESSDNDALKRISADWAEAGGACRLLHQRWQAIKI